MAEAAVPGAADRHLTTQRLADVIDRQLRLLALAQDSARMGVENFTGFRWRDPRLVRISNCWSISPSVVATCWLRAGWAICKTSAALGQTADIDDFHKIFQSS